MEYYRKFGCQYKISPIPSLKKRGASHPFKKGEPEPDTSPFEKGGHKPYISPFEKGGLRGI